jgi:myo-inositol-1(or 4)-monophosphatase
MLAFKASQYRELGIWLACIKDASRSHAKMGDMRQQDDAVVSTERLLAVAVEASTAAGKVLLDYARSGFHVERKNPINLVTDADYAAEQCIIDHIRRHFPTHQTLAEERGVGTDASSRYRWIIDPLDGTTNFAHGFPVYAISIGVECDGALLVGAVYDPTRDELFMATAGRGAFLNGRSIAVSDTGQLEAALTVTGFAYDIRETSNNNLDHFARFALKAQGVRRTGSAALDLCYVAAGRFDGFWEVKLSPWDMAGGVVIVREAGGRVTDLRGKEHSIYQPELVASNGRIHQEMLDVIRESLRP